MYGSDKNRTEQQQKKRKTNRSWLTYRDVNEIQTICFQHNVLFYACVFFFFQFLYVFITRKVCRWKNEKRKKNWKRKNDKKWIEQQKKEQRQSTKKNNQCKLEWTTHIFFWEGANGTITCQFSLANCCYSVVDHFKLIDMQRKKNFFHFRDDSMGFQFHNEYFTFEKNEKFQNFICFIKKRKLTIWFNSMKLNKMQDLH